MRIRVDNPSREIKIQANMAEFKPVEGFVNEYSVSKDGRVLSHPKRCSNVFGKILKQYINHTGYHSVVLQNGYKVKHMVHVLVAKAFIPNPENKPQVNHKDGNKSNNCVENLEWVTASENIHHAFKTGLRKPTHGTINGMSKLNDEVVRSIRAEYKSGTISQEKLGVKYGVSQTCIHKVVTGKRWTTI